MQLYRTPPCKEKCCLMQPVGNRCGVPEAVRAEEPTAALPTPAAAILLLLLLLPTLPGGTRR